MNQLLALVRDLEAKVGQPFQCGEALARPAVFGRMDHLPLFSLG